MPATWRNTNHPLAGIWNDTPTPCFANILAHNQIHEVMLTLSDGAGMYTLRLQPGTTLNNNLIPTIPIDAGAAESNDIFYDQGSTSLSIDANAIFSVIRSPLRFHLSEVNVVSNYTLLLSDAAVPLIRYNATDPANIVMSGNDISTPTAPVDCEHSVSGVVPLADLEPVYHQGLLGAPTADGCARCNGVPYSGLTYNACGVCGGATVSCGIPTVSLWGLVIMFLLIDANHCDNRPQDREQQCHDEKHPFRDGPYPRSARFIFIDT